MMNSLSIDNITTSFLDDQNKLPLIISPRYNDTLSFLTEWLTHNRSWVEEQMLTYGAVLIRGFDISSPVELEKAILALQPNLCQDYRGTSPRSVFDGTDYIFSAADVPATYPIGQHVEMAFLKAPPRQLYFGCIQAPSNSIGGETSLCDFRKVYNELDPSLRDKFQRLGLQYNRTHPKVGSKWSFDVGSMLSWAQMFGTTDKKEVENISREEDAAAVQWIGKDNDTFFQSWQDDATQLHPVTGERVWFNHAQVFHWSTFPAELWYAFTRIQDIRFLLRAIIIGIVAVVKYVLLGHRMALDVRFGNDTPISVSEMQEIRRVVHKNMVFSTWQQGDIMAIDNFSTSHGRQPTYGKGRKIAVAWSNPHDKTSTPSSIEKKTDKEKELRASCTSLLGDECVPGVVQVTPDSSPESTLTSNEAQELRNEFIVHQGRPQGDDTELWEKMRSNKHQSRPSLVDIFS